jgi:hypothetical protein
VASIDDYEDDDDYLRDLKTYPQCERCWIKDNSRWELDGVTADGDITSKLVAVAVPIDVTLGHINVCATCGDLTVVGIYAHLEEDEVNFDVDPLETGPYDSM